MADQDKKREEKDLFEQNLQEILSSGSSPEKKTPQKEQGFYGDRLKADRESETEPQDKRIVWFKLIRVVSFISLLGLLALFVYQTTLR
ncbi:MAG: hypothetical protein ACLFVQ_08435 [Chitinispirillaceae bacterium]